MGLYHIFHEVEFLNNLPMRYNELIVLKLEARTPSLSLPIVHMTLALLIKSCMRLCI